MRRFRMVIAVLALFVSAVGAQAQQRFTERWVYLSTNLLVEKNVDDGIALMERARKAGYTHVALADSKFGRLPSLDRRYFDNCRRFKAEADRIGIRIIPCIFPIGYSESLLSQDVNLAEGLPVRDAVFQVAGGRARALTDPATHLVNGDFEDAAGDKFNGWGFQDFIGKSTFADRQVVYQGRTALRMENIGVVDPQNGHCRLSQLIDVKPFHYYHLSVWLKSEDFQTPSEAKLAVLTQGGGSLCYTDLGVKRTQDWTQHHVVFNSLTNDKVRIYTGVWNGKGGKLWWDDLRLEEPGLVNVLRRPGCPLVVKSEDGTRYVEGRDYPTVADPKLGQTPWPGGYESWHTPPEIVLTPGSHIKDGQKLLVSFYHPAIIYGGQVTIALSEPKTYEILDDQMRNMHELWRADGYFMSHDEIRVGNWSELSVSRKLTPGEILADNVRKCTAIARKYAPGATLYIWSDMFDPNHNAHDNYYLVNGTWAGSWEGLDKSVVVVNWYYGKRDVSLKWFADRGHRQVIAGYYDSAPERILDWIASARPVKGVYGVMYTTWQSNYKDLEAFAGHIK